MPLVQLCVFVRFGFIMVLYQNALYKKVFKQWYKFIILPHLVSVIFPHFPEYNESSTEKNYKKVTNYIINRLLHIKLEGVMGVIISNNNTINTIYQ